MDPAILLLLTVVVFGGIWGSLILVAVLKRYVLPGETPVDSRIEDLLEDSHQLQTRLERLEEEVGFLRELRSPPSSTRLPPADDPDA
ncbi:MAG: hypothetical protein PVI57_23375 [Gemmatimonadota bacterium]